MNEVHFVYIWMGIWYDMTSHAITWNYKTWKCACWSWKLFFSFFNYEKNIQTGYNCASEMIKYIITCYLTWHDVRHDITYLLTIVQVTWLTDFQVFFPNSYILRLKLTGLAKTSCMWWHIWHDMTCDMMWDDIKCHVT